MKPVKFKPIPFALGVALGLALLLIQALVSDPDESPTISCPCAAEQVLSRLDTPVKENRDED